MQTKARAARQTYPRQAAIEAMRDKVLAAMDEAAKELTGAPVIGAHDKHLPALFRILDATYEDALSEKGQHLEHGE